MVQVILTLALLSATCYALEDRYGSTTYAVKTPYSISHNETEWDIIFNSAKESQYVPSACKPISMDVLYRHGLRTPGEDDILVLQNLAARLRGRVQNPEYDALNRWVPPFDVDESSQLIEEGRKELYGLGSRAALRYAPFFANVTIEDVGYQVTSKQRAIDSGLYFQNGLSNTLGNDLRGPLVTRDDLIRYYDTCERYIQEVEENPEALKEIDAYFASQRVQDIARNVTERLGLLDMQITLDEINAVYKSFTAEKSLNFTSPWEGVLTEEELALLEYGLDLQNYWAESWAYNISYESACGLLSSVFDQMDNAKEQEYIGNQYRKALFRFGHSHGLMSFSTLVGIFQPEVPLRSDNVDDLLYSRRYRSGTIIPMASSLAFVLYKCDPDAPIGSPPLGVSWPDTLDEYMVQFLLNEIPMRFPACGYDLCPYNQVRNAYSQYIGCNLEDICSLP